MSSQIDQKAYLQKYLGGSYGDKKKRKKKATKGKGFKIIDDDIDLSKLRPLDGDELDILDEGEDAPQIAGIVDDRPEEMKQLEQLKTSSRWKVVTQDDGFNSKLKIEEIKKDIKESAKENELIFGKMYSDSEDEKNNDSDLSPPRKLDKQKISKTQEKHNSDSDFSPPRKRGNNGTNVSPKQDRPKDRVKKPSRWGDEVETNDQTKRSKSDASPPRRSKKYDSDTSPSRKSRKKYDDSDQSPERESYDAKDRRNVSPSKRRVQFSDQQNKYSEGDSRTSRNNSKIFPPRKKRKESPEKHKKRYHSDESPPRRESKKDNNSHRSKRNNDSPTLSSKRGKYQSDSDESPPRRESNKDLSNSHRSKKDNDSPSFNKKISRIPERKRYHSDSDESPPRRENKRDKSDSHSSKRDNDSPPPSNKKMARTLEGKMAGLQNAKELRQENSDFRRREDEVFNKMSDEVSGRNAKAVSRKGKRQTSEERQQQKEKSERQKEIEEKYNKWGRGLKQLEDQEARVQEFMHESSKPLARHKGDRDLESSLKQIERAGDPMLQYIKDSKRGRGEIAPEKPSYRGSFPPNRFNIRPGYRWDGVDRSNGYEKKYFEQQSKSRAQEEELYKWSTEDL